MRVQRAFSNQPVHETTACAAICTGQRHGPLYRVRRQCRGAVKKLVFDIGTSDIEAPVAP